MDAVTGSAGGGEVSDKLISANRLYEKVAGLEEMARDRYLDTTTCLPNGGVNPSAIRYGAQMNERTAFKHMIADAPTVDAMPVRHAKWIYGEDCVAMCDGYRCSNCGFFVPWDYQHKFISYIEEYNYCPNCGARMDAERKEE